jgi:hypothetical protein
MAALVTSHSVRRGDALAKKVALMEKGVGIKCDVKKIE